MNSFWDNRYKKEGNIWGDKPSKTVYIADKLFKTRNIKRILVPGSGYGRNTQFFADRGYDVTGIEVSETAVEIAKNAKKDINYIRGSILDINLTLNLFDGIYCFNVLHLFLKNDREILIKKIRDFLNDNGLAFFVVFSEKEENFGKGKKIEENTFETRPGRPAHYFTEEDLLFHFKNYNIIETGLIEEAENHGEAPHVHYLRYICISK